MVTMQVIQIKFMVTLALGVKLKGMNHNSITDLDFLKASINNSSELQKEAIANVKQIQGYALRFFDKFLKGKEIAIMLPNNE